MITLTTTKRRPRYPKPEAKGEQLRVRLRTWERESLEKVRLQHLQAGHPEADTLSSWVRYQIEPFLNPAVNRHYCHISTGTYQKVEELARLLNKTPEAVIGECVDGIEHLTRQELKGVPPLIVAECRLRKQYGTGSQKRNVGS